MKSSTAQKQIDNQNKLKSSTIYSNHTNSIVPEINKPKSTAQKSDIQLRMIKIESVLAILSNQNESLIKRIEELEKEKTSTIKKIERNSNTSSSISTEGNSLENESFNNYQSYIEMDDWKKEIEKSIERLNERVNKDNISEHKYSNKGSEDVINNSIKIASQNKVVEDKLEHKNSEFEKVKTFMETFYKMEEEANKKFEKFLKLELLIGELINQINNMRKNNISWQSDFLKNMNDFNEKILNQEILLDQLEKFENITNKKIETLFSDFKKLPNEITAKKAELESKIIEFDKAISGINLKFIENEKIKDEMIKTEMNIKALWDSFTFLSDSLICGNKL